MDRREQSATRRPSRSREPWWARRVGVVPVWLCGVMFVAVFATLTALGLADGSGDGTPPVAVATTPVSATADAPTAPPTAPEQTTTIDATTVPPTTTTTTTTTPRTTTTTRSTTTTTPAPTTTSIATTTTSAAARESTTSVATSTSTVPELLEPQTITGDAGQILTVTPRRDACRAGSNCLVVSFTIGGFAFRPNEFVCEFSSGARLTFRFVTTTVDSACTTRDVPDSIVVEVAGLRSDPIPNLQR